IPRSEGNVRQRCPLLWSRPGADLKSECLHDLKLRIHAAVSVVEAGTAGVASAIPAIAPGKPRFISADAPYIYKV
ncbi:MAG: hypothetical protein J6J61_02470, partial [Muribaculaceae bacterium]|nr:hypothetical protein [Muribaculaceae bacterium]